MDTEEPLVGDPPVRVEEAEGVLPDPSESLGLDEFLPFFIHTARRSAPRPAPTTALAVRNILESLQVSPPTVIPPPPADSPPRVIPPSEGLAALDLRA